MKNIPPVGTNPFQWLLVSEGSWEHKSDLASPGPESAFHPHSAAHFLLPGRALCLERRGPPIPSKMKTCGLGGGRK